MPAGQRGIAVAQSHSEQSFQVCTGPEVPAKGATHETVALQEPGVVLTAIFAGQELNTGN